MLLSRKATERDSGSSNGSISDTAVVRDLSVPLGSSPTTTTLSPERSGALLKAAAPHLRPAQELRIVLHHREIVQRMDVDHLGRNLHRVRESQAHVADRHRHGVAVGDHEPMLGIDDQSGALVVALAHPGKRVRHVEAHADERGCQARRDRITRHRCGRSAPFRRRRLGGRREVEADPSTHWRRCARSGAPETSAGPCTRIAARCDLGHRASRSAR